MLYEQILANKELLKVIFALIVVFICFIIVLKTDRMFKLSNHQGLRYFRNAFFFYGVAFIARFILGGIPITSQEHQIINLLFMDFFFEFFIITAGFFLLYSLIWRHMEKEKNYHSVLNLRMVFFYSFALIFSVLDTVFATKIFLYFSQITLFIILVFISGHNYLLGDKKYKFLKYYFLIMLLGLITWIFNMITDYFLNWNKKVQILIYALNFLFFIFFFYAIKQTTRGKHGQKKG